MKMTVADSKVVLFEPVFADVQLHRAFVICSHVVPSFTAGLTGALRILPPRRGPSRATPVSAAMLQAKCRGTGEATVAL